MTTYAILPYKDEFCVAHLGIVRVTAGGAFVTGWIVDCICPTIPLAVEAQLAYVAQSKTNHAIMKADLSARGIRHG